MNQEMAVNWSLFGYVFADALLFGLFYALFVRWLSGKKVEGQTAYLVVFGVAVILLLSIPLVGLLYTALLFALFAASGFFMVIEYVDRIHREKKSDLEALKRIAEEAVGHDDEASIG